MVKSRLGNAFSLENCAAGVVLTGGTAKLPGIASVAARVFGVPAHLGEAPSWISENLRDPGYHTALGLLYCGVGSRTERLGARGQGGGFLAGLRKLFSQS